MAQDLEALASLISDRAAGLSPWRDILEDFPDCTEEDAYRVQFALMRRRAAAGDDVVGYKAAYTSAAVQAARKVGGPVVGGLLRSGMRSEAQPLPMVQNTRNAVEPEIALLLAHDVPGPRVTPLDMRRATALMLPAIEVTAGAPGNAERSRPMLIATSKVLGSIVVGGPGLSPGGIDLRTEGCVLSINGTMRGSATAAEVMGDPFVAAALIAETVLAYGEQLRAGMVLMTGSIIPATPVSAGDDVRVEFTRLGNLHIRFGA